MTHEQPRLQTESSASQGGGRLFPVMLPEFAGPLDLLLSLIEKRELDISRLSLVEVTDQYIAKLHEDGAINPEEASDFLVIAARLVLLKSISLLPSQSSPEPDDDDPGDELTRMLIEYKRVKELADDLRRLEEAGQRSYARLAPVIPEEVERPLSPISSDRLLQALQRALDRLPEEPRVEAAVQEITIGSKSALIRSLLTGRSEISFDEVVERAESRTAVVLSLLALLELLKASIIDVRQDEIFGDIAIFHRAAPPLEPDVAAEGNDG